MKTKEKVLLGFSVFFYVCVFVFFAINNKWLLLGAVTLAAVFSVLLWESAKEAANEAAEAQEVAEDMDSINDRSENIALKEELAALKSEIGHLKARIKTQDEQLKSKDTDNKTQNETFKEKEDSIKEREAALKTKEDAFKEREAALKTKEDAFNEKGDSVKSLKADLAAEKSRADALQKALDAARKNEPLESEKEEKVVIAAAAPSVNPDLSILPKASGEEKLDIIVSIKETVKEFKKEAKKAGVNINIVNSSDKLFVKADRMYVKTMFRDIIDNAIKYMGKSGTLQITVANMDGDIFVAMKDNGEGLAKDETEHVFELNFQGSNRISGNGLGLAQAKAIVDYYGGLIYAKSSLGNGMGIYIHLPAEVTSTEDI
ncbi:MAG: hypothetical protein K6F00_01655 [Lachnospiraceae bacterium]|nr:hypothetical protein [Lachnospiraceae bacterium]